MFEKNVEESKEIFEVRARNRFLSKVYLWMTVALAISGGTAFIASNYEPLMGILFWHKGLGFMFLFLAELLLVYWLSASIRRISARTATIAFLVYSLMNGVTLSSIFLIYRIDSIFLIFLISAALFAVMAVYGSFTSSNLTSVGRYFGMALTGIIIASFANFLLKSPKLDWLLSVACVLVFTGLTAYDAQKLMRASSVAESQDEDVFQKASIIGALELYLDFINIFLALLRLFGKGRGRR